MFKKIGNAKRQLKDEDMVRILIRGEYGVLGTTGENEYSYTTPLNYVYPNNAIYFHGAMKVHASNIMTREHRHSLLCFYNLITPDVH